MTVRDWLDLLVVPLALVVIGFYLSSAQDERQRQIEENQRAQQAQIEEQRAAAEQELAEQRAQDEALQAYLDQMSQLMLERKLLETEPGDPVHTLAQARTSTAILRLDAAHNESVTRFLITSGLAVDNDPSGAVYRGPPALRSEASARLLSGIALSHATLSDAQLPDADLSYADLSRAALWSADLSDAVLSGADLSDAVLSGADLNDAVLGANLSNADLTDANLSGAVLSGADLSEAILDNAILEGADGITNEELDQQAVSLDDATMPNGQKYEEWLKDREKRQQDE
jgi:uncharacterized protein YjbI with pentapeptide repeats